MLLKFQYLATFFETNFQKFPPPFANSRLLLVLAQLSTQKEKNLRIFDFDKYKLWCVREFARI